MSCEVFLVSDWPWVWMSTSHLCIKSLLLSSVLVCCQHSSLACRYILIFALISPQAGGKLESWCDLSGPLELIAGWRLKMRASSVAGNLRALHEVSLLYVVARENDKVHYTECINTCLISCLLCHRCVGASVFPPVSLYDSILLYFSSEVPTEELML